MEKKLLNKRNELQDKKNALDSKCRHENKFLLTMKSKKMKQVNGHIKISE